LVVIERKSHHHHQARTLKEAVMAEPSKYGKYYWCLKSDLSEDGEIYVHADEVRVTPTGGVLFVSKDVNGEHVRLAVASGKWSAVFAASLIDGSAIAVEHWKGEVTR
jgi:hypothetical protein